MALAVVSILLFLPGCDAMKSSPPQDNPPPPPPPPSNQPFTVTVTPAGGGTGTVTSAPSGIDCGSTCSATFDPDTQVTLTAKADANFQFAGWSGACSGAGDCTVPANQNSTVSANFVATLQSINHIIFMSQENRGFLHYFGAMKDYWLRTGFPPQEFDGWTQFNTPGAPPESSPGCDPAITTDCVVDSNSPQVQSFHMISQCMENSSPSWNESHVDWNANDPMSPAPLLDGFIRVAAHHARGLGLTDVNGTRVMGYYTDADLPYYYFMASSFATSDSWFSPAMTRTQPNRMYLMAATSDGHAYPLPIGAPQLTNKTIFELLEDAGISWKIYVTDDNLGSLPPHTELGGFTFANSHMANFVSATKFFDDLNNGTLPAVSEIDPGFAKGLDEHAGEDDGNPSGKIQAGAHYVSTLINALMQSQYWKDSVFILTWDENGGFYDHVAPQPMPSPDGIKPVDLDTTAPTYDICADPIDPPNPPTRGTTCDFVYTGYRVPLIVVSPFTKKNYVSHTPADYTAILKFIETRFLSSATPNNLTNRDVVQMDMTEFFDFTNVPWKVPPDKIPQQPNTMPCYEDHLP